ncbi:glycosyltransferase family 2 protein [Butyrivibrio sp. INlla14]|uniref:glycosyltransferase family 2 protein n=1 Tax=Butyrivibrio sp. INlla14 TaxID=1520808 RepID=UPI000876F507|nr:glycosyltransferase family 2 protein [Butyrivibrio sp. INlla14]SCY70284.1 Glycosyl transferase family 2 [Butyrivibrio sp. INlla14]
MSVGKHENNPLLSVVVPVYGVEAYLHDCIESIIKQEYSNLEILLVDDGSKGKEGQICDEYAAIDDRIRVIHKKNEGLIAARKTGMQEATAEYIAFIDGDDFIAPDYYLKMMKLVKSECPDLVSVSFTQYFSKERCEVVRQRMESGVYENDALIHLFENMNCMNENYYDFSVFPSTCLKIYRTDLLKDTSEKIPENIRFGEDSAFSYPYILACKKIVIDNDIDGYFYRVVENSMSKEFDKNRLVEADILYKYLKNYYSMSENKRVSRQLEIYRFFLLEDILKQLMMGVRLWHIHGKVKEIQNLIEKSEIFVELKIYDYDIPSILKKNLLFICKKDWKGFEKAWNRRELAHCFHALARRALGGK